MQYRIPLKQGDIEDLMVMLDQDFDECLGYAEVSRGLAALRMERRALKRRGQVVSATTLSRSSPSSILPKISREHFLFNHSSGFSLHCNKVL